MIQPVNEVTREPIPTKMQKTVVEQVAEIVQECAWKRFEREKGPFFNAEAD